jgi:tetratricopeptide (TPR) repeat protein
MSEQIFISYRRDDTSHAAGRLRDHLTQKFPTSRIFMDIDNLHPGEVFAEVIKKSVESCQILIAVIGPHWACDARGKRRFNSPGDWVRLEVSTALKRGIWVMPVLVDGTPTPKLDHLPSDIRAIIGRQAVQLSHDRFASDSERIIHGINNAFEKAAAEEQKRLAAKARELAEKERLEAELRERERVEAEPLQQRLQNEQRQREEIKEHLRLEALFRLPDDDPFDAKFFCIRGYEFLEKGEYDKAIIDFSKAIMFNPLCGPMYGIRAMAYFEKKEFDNAIDDFTSAINLWEPNRFLYHGRALAFQAQGKNAEAQADRKKAGVPLRRGV